MRLSEHATKVTVSTAKRPFGEDASVWLFGSRMDDGRTLRNGLIDEYVEDAADFAQALNTTKGYSGELTSVVSAIETWLDEIGFDPR